MGVGDCDCSCRWESWTGRVYRQIDAATSTALCPRLKATALFDASAHAFSPQSFPDTPASIAILRSF